MRRGRPSCHKAFGEATALLAGDNDKNIPVEWSSKKLELVDYRSAKNRFFVRVSGTDKTFVEKGE